jgi:hypothetical protein
MWSFAEEKREYEKEGVYIGGWGVSNFLWPKKTNGVHGKRKFCRQIEESGLLTSVQIVPKTAFKMSRSTVTGTMLRSGRCFANSTCASSSHAASVTFWPTWIEQTLEMSRFSNPGLKTTSSKLSISRAESSTG